MCTKYSVCFPLDSSVPAATRPHQTEISAGRGAGHGADPAGGRSRSSGPTQTGRIHHQHHGVFMCSCA